MQYGYIRIENDDQKVCDFFAEKLKDFSLSQIYIDRNSDGKEIGGQLTALLEQLQPRDEIITQACTTLSPDEVTLQKIIARIRNKKASVRFLDLTNHGMENPALRALKSQQTQRWC